MDRKAPAIAQNIQNWATTILVGGWNRATLPHVFTGRLPPGYWAVLTNTSHYIQQIWMLGYFFCKVICICQNSSVAGRQPPGEDVGEGCSVPATYQIGRSSILNILGNSWGLPIHVLRVVWIFVTQLGRRFAPPSWLRQNRRHCRSFGEQGVLIGRYLRWGWVKMRKTGFNCKIIGFPYNSVIF